MSEVLMPEIATTEQVAEYLKLEQRTVYNYTGSKAWVKGVYLGRGRYNMTRLKEAINTPPYRYVIGLKEVGFCNDLRM